MSEIRSARVLVGYDGSVTSGAAVEWAAAEAARRGAPLEVISVADMLRLPAIPPVTAAVLDSLRASAAEIARAGAELARKAAPGVAVTATGEAATSVAGMLVERSRAVDLLVVATRGHGEVLGMLLGSVAFAVTAHAACPVVVVRGSARDLPGPDRPVVVGVDGSPAALAAVRWAADLAAGASAPLVLVSAYPSGIGGRETSDLMEALEHGGMPDIETVARRHALDGVEAALAAVREMHPGLEVQTRVEEGVVVRLLDSAAVGAGLLVVGARGEGGFAGLRIGSVTHAAVHGSPCPVAVVHEPGLD